MGVRGCVPPFHPLGLPLDPLCRSSEIVAVTPAGDLNIISGTRA